MSLLAPRFALRSLLAITGAVTLACGPASQVDVPDGGDGTGLSDAGTGPGNDAGTNPGFDAGTSPGNDAGTSPGNDGGTSPDSDAGTHPGEDAGPSPGDDAGTGGEDAGTVQCTPPEGRGLRWVRENPMMISALTVMMGAPTPAHVNAYFDDFGANAVHLWENGLPVEISAWHAAGRDDFRYISWVNKDGTSLANGQVLGGMAPLPGRIGYQVGDEPNTQEHFDEIAAGLEVVRQADPDGLRILNLHDANAGYQFREAAANLETVDILSYDHYSYRTDVHEGLNDTRRKALAAGKPYWRYMESFWYKHKEIDQSLSDMRWDAFVGAVYGYTGYTWFLYSIEASNPELHPLLFETPGSFDAQRTQFFDYAAAINRELATLGRALVMLTSTDVRYIARYALLHPQGISSWSPGAGGDPYLADIEVTGNRDLLVGFFVDDCGEHYVMVQSQQHSSGIPPNRGTSTTEVTLRFDFSQAPMNLDDTYVESFDISTGNIVDLVLTSDGPTSASLPLTLGPGEPLLFKYATGRPFALQEL